MANQLTPTAPAPVPGGKRPQIQPIMVFRGEAFRDLAQRLAEGRFDSLDWYLARREAERASVFPGFEELIGLDLNRIDEYPHQLQVVRTALQQMRGRALLADEVGLGKTIEAGLILKELVLRGLVRRVLILVPASLTTQWQEEMQSKFGEAFVINSDENGWARHDRIIASIDTAKRDNHANVIAGQSYDLVIVDEAHRLRNRQTQLWKFVNRIRKKYILLLTATPVHNQLEELYNIITLLKPGLLGTPRAFRSRFVDPHDPRRPKNTVELKALLRQVMVRTRRSEAMIVLPPRKAYIYKVGLSREERELYAQASQALRRAALHGIEPFSTTVALRELCSSSAAASATLRRLAGRQELPRSQRRALRALADLGDAAGRPSKAEAVVKIVAKARDRVLIFTDFRRTQEEIIKALGNAHLEAVAFHGGLSASEKEAAVAHFRNKPVALVSTEIGAEGRNLQFCNVIINYDIPWNPLLIEQRIGRLHRLGQQREVYVFNLSAQGTIEDRILRLLAEKLRMFELVVGELDLVLGQVRWGESFESTIQELWLRSRDDDELQRGLDRLAEDIVKARDRFADIKEAELIVSKLFQ